MIIQCCLCRQVRSGKEWVVPEASDLTDPHVSHGYCPACAARAFAEIRQMAGATGRLIQRAATS